MLQKWWGVLWFHSTLLYCRCVLHLLNRAEFVFTTGENPLSQRARLVCWAQSPSCHSTVVACSVGEAEPRKCSESRSLPSSCGSVASSKSPAAECKAGWLAWCNQWTLPLRLGVVSRPRWRINCVYSYRSGQLWSFCSSTHHASLPHLWVLIVWGCLCLTFQKHWFVRC